ncbi:hypothetical protein L2755_14270 [Shewanella abyssi]|uniref:hypothetical protein n=1 Tax=Shewanella abyssi TaxID=311789 RepID=UPI00200E228D|nr:hypothetical protein [Shewanella abyssi]MCL1050780.1 hypothetical protein [Shewanella abyssi]
MKRSWFLVFFLLALAAKADADSGAQFDTLLGFQLNRSDLGLVEAKLGSAIQFEVPDGHHEFAICYLIDGDTTITFNSGHEFGGPERELLGFSINSGNPNDFPCAVLPTSERNLSLAGISLDMRRNEFLRVMGMSLQTNTKKTVSRIFSSVRKLTPAELTQITGKPWSEGLSTTDVTMGVVGHFENDVMVAFSAHRVETF